MARRYQITFRSLDLPWSTNDDRRLNEYARHEKVQHWKALAKIAWGTQGKRQNIGKGLIRVTIPFAQHRRRDPSNYCGTVGKAIIDGLVEAGVWPDDTAEYVMHLEPVLRVTKLPNTIVEIWPWTELDPAIQGLLLPPI